MCFILATTNLSQDHIARLKDEWFMNSDGAGFACYRNSLLYSRKGFFKWGKLSKALRPLIGSTCVVHLRNATHGIINEDNCHPFLTCNGEAFMAHNGILPFPFSSDCGVSDTLRMSQLLREVTWASLNSSIRQIERVIGYNKLVWLNTSGEILIANPEYGTWLKKKETWISAKEHKYSKAFRFVGGTTTVNGKTHMLTDESDEHYYRDLAAQAEKYVNGLPR